MNNEQRILTKLDQLDETLRVHSELLAQIVADQRIIKLELDKKKDGTMGRIGLLPAWLIRSSA